MELTPDEEAVLKVICGRRRLLTVKQLSELPRVQKLLPAILNRPLRGISKFSAAVQGLIDKECIYVDINWRLCPRERLGKRR